jgi:cytoskeletal protein RodZ
MVSNNGKEFGELFKGRREEMNLSLKEIENATSIRTGYLQAIEDGDMKKLISPIYAQGFVKQYATFLGLDGEEIIKKNPEFFTLLASPEFSYGIGTLEMRGNPGSGIKWLPNVLWVSVFIFLFVVAYFMAKFFEVI